MSTISSQFSIPLNRTLPLTTMSTPAANQGRFAGDKTLISQVPDLEINVTGTRAFQRYPQIKSSVLDEITRTKGWKDIGVLNIPAGREFKPVKLYRATVNGRDVYAIIKPDTKDVYIPMASVRSGTPYKTISDRVTDLVRGQFNNAIRVTTGERSIGTPRVNAPIRPGHNGGSVEPSTWTQPEQDDFIKWMMRSMPVEKSAFGWTSIFVTVMSDPALRETVTKQYLTNKNAALRDIPEVLSAIQNTRNKVEDAADALSIFGFLSLKGGSLRASVAEGTAKARQVWNQIFSGAQRNLSGQGMSNLFKNLTVNPFSKMREAVGSRGWAPLKNLIPGTVDAGKQLIGGAAVTGWNALKNPRPVIDAAFKAGLKVAGSALDPTKPIALQIPTLIQNFPKPAALKPNASAQEKLDYKNAMEQREVKLSVAFSAILLRYFGASFKSDTPGAVGQMVIGSTGGAISAAVFSENKTPSEFLLYMTLGAFSSKNVSQQIFGLGKNAAAQRQAFRFGVPAFDNYVATNVQLSKLGLTDIAQVTLSRMVASVGFNTLSQEVAALKNKGQLIIPNGAQVLGSAMSGGLRASGYASAFKNIPATYYGKIVPYVVPMLASVISSSIIKKMFGETKKPETLTPAELKKVEAATVEYITANSAEIDLMAKNIAIATVGAAATPKTKR